MSSKWLPDELVLFLDRSLGSRKISDYLRMRNMRVETHDTHFRVDERDEVWIELVGQKNWVAITGDKRLRHSEAARLSISRYSSRVIVLIMKNVRAIEQAEILFQSRHRLWQFIKRTKPPYLAKLYRDGKVTKWWP